MMGDAFLYLNSEVIVNLRGGLGDVINFLVIYFERRKLQKSDTT
jgi:hypothetical protein